MEVTRTYSEEVDRIKADLLVLLKKHLRITVSDFDSELELLIESAIEIAERETGCMFLPSEFKITSKSIIDVFGYYPVFEATSLKIDGVESDIEEVQISGGKVSVQTDEGREIEVTFDAGYTVFPAPVKVAIFLMAGAWWQKPIDSVETLPKASTNLLKNYRRWLR